MTQNDAKSKSNFKRLEQRNPKSNFEQFEEKNQSPNETRRESIFKVQVTRSDRTDSKSNFERLEPENPKSNWNETSETLQSPNKSRTSAKIQSTMQTRRSNRFKVQLDLCQKNQSPIETSENLQRPIDTRRRLRSAWHKFPDSVLILTTLSKLYKISVQSIKNIIRTEILISLPRVDRIKTKSSEDAESKSNSKSNQHETSEKIQSPSSNGNEGMRQSAWEEKEKKSKD
jgi:hypothetical protein